jgi:DNA-binding Lrp family transcriptional regulator
MDEIDRKILRILQEDATIQNQDLAARVGLSASPCLRRVKALEAAGVIRRYVALVDGKAVGAGFVAFVEVRLEKQAEAYSKRFETAMLGRTEVIDCCFVTGDFDYLIKVAVADIPLPLQQTFTRFNLAVTTIAGGHGTIATVQ